LNFDLFAGLGAVSTTLRSLVIIFFIIILLQMNHPIQVKPADTVNKGGIE